MAKDPKRALNAGLNNNFQALSLVLIGAGVEESRRTQKKPSLSKNGLKKN